MKEVQEAIERVFQKENSEAQKNVAKNMTKKSSSTKFRGSTDLDGEDSTIEP